MVGGGGGGGGGGEGGGGGGGGGFGHQPQSTVLPTWMPKLFLLHAHKAMRKIYTAVMIILNWTHFEPHSLKSLVLFMLLISFYDLILLSTPRYSYLALSRPIET